MIYKNITKIITILILLLPLNVTFANTGDLYFSGTTIFNDIDYSSLETELEKEILNFSYTNNDGTFLGDFQTLNYKQDLQDIKEILFQALLIIFFVGFFHLTWLFYTFYNDLLGKK